MRVFTTMRKLYRGLKKRAGNHPIRVRFFLINYGVIFLFLGIIFITNAILLKPYYNYTKENKLRSTLVRITEMDFSDTDTHDYASEKVVMRLRALEEEGNLHIIILDESLRFFYMGSELTPQLVPLESYDGAKELFNSLYKQIDAKGQGTLESPAISRRLNTRTDTEVLSLYAVVPAKTEEDSSYYHVLINTSISAIEDAVTAFNDYALVLGFFAMVISGLVSTILCSKFVRPILRINEAASRIANMDFSVKLDISSNDELGQLAQSINHLASELESNIGQLRIANARLMADIEEKEKIDTMRRELLSNVSHEFKTPLAIIMGYCEGLMLNVNNEEKDYYCSVISDEAVKLNNLASRLLDLAELESGAIMDVTEFNLAELAEERLKTMSYIFWEHHITTDFSSSGSCVLTADYGRIEEVINNLLSNAQHHTPDGGRIRVTVTDDGNRVICTIFNSGSHIPDDSLSRIWESFYKVDKARKRKYGGSGLGLKIVSSIVNLHGGSYSADNTWDGVFFRFTLPKNSSGKTAPPRI